MADPLPQPGAGQRVVFLLDCDNTLLDNDALKDDMAARLRALLGEPLAARFWNDYEAVRRLADVVDLPRTFERFRPACPSEVAFTQARAIVMEYPFAARLYPDTLATLAHLDAIGTAAILSDGDNTYQPRKIERSGLAAAVGGRVAIYAHKEDHLAEVIARWPAPYYVMVDDKAHLLAAIKRLLPNRFVTVWVEQGHYAALPETFIPAPDVTIRHIGDLRALSLDQLGRHLETSA